MHKSRVGWTILLYTMCFVLCTAVSSSSGNQVFCLLCILCCLCVELYVGM